MSSCKAPAVKMAIVEVVVTLKGREVPMTALDDQRDNSRIVPNHQWQAGDCSRVIEYGLLIYKPTGAATLRTVTAVVARGAWSAGRLPLCRFLLASRKGIGPQESRGGYGSLCGIIGSSGVVMICQSNSKMT